MHHERQTAQQITNGIPGAFEVYADLAAGVFPALGLAVLCRAARAEGVSTARGLGTHPAASCDPPETGGFAGKDLLSLLNLTEPS